MVHFSLNFSIFSFRVETEVVAEAASEEECPKKTKIKKISPNFFFTLKFCLNQDTKILSFCVKFHFWNKKKINICVSVANVRNVPSIFHLCLKIIFRVSPSFSQTHAICIFHVRL